MTDHTLPSLPKKRNGRGLAVGPGVFWWKIWNEYHEAGGYMGYGSWIEENRKLQKEAEMRKQMEKKRKIHGRLF
jgi:hypothetical protein